MDVEFDERGATLRPGPAERRLALSLRQYGCKASLKAVSPVAPRAAMKNSESTPESTTEYIRPGLREWYVNRKEGLEQGFTLNNPPCGEGAGLVFEVGFSGATPVLRGDDVELQDAAGATSYRYSALHAFDAAGAALPSHMEVRGAAVQLVVDDSGARYPVTVDPLVWIFMQKLVASDGVTKDQLGTALAMSADTAVVGAPNAAISGKTLAGAAYVYALGSSWAEQAKLQAGDATESGGFGASVAISGDTIVVGSPDAEVMGTLYVGAAYVFTRSGTTWTQQAKLVASDAAAYDNFGRTVSISGDTIVVGAQDVEDLSTFSVGAAYVFTRSGTSWTQQAKLLAPVRTDYDQFGSTVAIDGDTAAIAATGADSGSTIQVGAVYIWTRSGTTWSEQAKIDPPAASLGTRGNFGRSLALSNGSVAIGSDISRVSIFVRSGTTWSEQTSMSSTYSLGKAVALVGDVVLIGAPGMTFFGRSFVHARSGTTWGKTGDIEPFDAATGDLFGAAVALGGDWSLIATPNAKLGSAVEVGAVYAFKRDMSKTNGAACVANSECTSGYCADKVCCNSNCGSGSLTDCQACSVAAGAMIDGTCGTAKSSIVCRPSADLCDAADLCNGTSTLCPTDKALPSGTPCRAAAGVCDTAESCDGTSRACPSNAFKSSGECRAATGGCDLAERCDGTSADCPADKWMPLLSICRTAAGPCDVNEYCSGFSRDCPMDKFATGGSCRASAGPCDVAESCDGTRAACPADVFASSSTVCRAAARDCDAPESCSGSSPSCPSDDPSANGSACPTGRCDKGACLPEADLRVTLEADTQVVKAQQPILFTATVTNAGRAEAMTVALVLANPPTAALAQLGGPGWGCQSAAGGAVCTIDKLAVGRSAALTMSLVPPLEQTVFNVSAQAKCAIPDPVPENNFVTLLVKNAQPGPGGEPPIPEPPMIPDSHGGCSYVATAQPTALLSSLPLLAILALLHRRRRSLRIAA